MGPFSIIIEPGPNLILFGKTLDMQFQIYTYLSSYSAETENFNFFSKFKGDNSVKISSGLDQIQAWPAYFYDKSIHQKLAWMCGTVAKIINRKLMMTEWRNGVTVYIQW